MEHPDTPVDNEALFKNAPRHGFFGELWHFLRTSKKWWMLPLIVSFVLMGVILVLGKTAAAPFIYTLF
ncbi:MAG: DUF5989 family protein [Acidobacteriota bacterium]